MWRQTVTNRSATAWHHLTSPLDSSRVLNFRAAWIVALLLSVIRPAYLGLPAHQTLLNFARHIAPQPLPTSTKARESQNGQSRYLCCPDGNYMHMHVQYTSTRTYAVSDPQCNHVIFIRQKARLSKESKHTSAGPLAGQYYLYGPSLIWSDILIASYHWWYYGPPLSFRWPLEEP